MYDELTKQDIRKMQEEIDYRVQPVSYTHLTLPTKA